MKSQTTKIYSQLDEDDIKLIAALLRELGYGAEGALKSAKINIGLHIFDGKVEVEWIKQVEDNA